MVLAGRRSHWGLARAVDTILCLTDSARGNLEPAYYWWHLTNMEQWLITKQTPWESLMEGWFWLTGFYWNDTKGFCLRDTGEELVLYCSCQSCITNIFLLVLCQYRRVHIIPESIQHQKNISVSVRIWHTYIGICSGTQTTNKNHNFTLFGCVSVEWTYSARYCITNKGCLVYINCKK